MKLITWNCNMAFRKKAQFILPEEPDILIIPECENRERLQFQSNVKQPSDIFWYGSNPNKGLGVFAYGDFKIELIENHNPDFKYVLPLLIRNSEISLTVLAIWAQKPENHDCYTEQIWNAVHYYADLLQNKVTRCLPNLKIFPAQ